MRIWAVTLLATAAVSVLAQQPPTFKSGVDTVEIHAVVSDKKGQIVNGLHQSDFAVREDGKLVSIESFAELDADDPATAGDARFVVLLLDDWMAPLIPSTCSGSRDASPIT
jgi:hypothetical protein